MKILILSPGKSQNPYIKSLIEIYLKRLEHYTACKFITFASYGNKSNPSLQKEKEYEQLLSKLGEKDKIALLDEKGLQMSSLIFSKFIEGQVQPSFHPWAFIIGGAYGFSEKLYQRANIKISLSAMTFPYEIARLVFVEQLYRSFCILNKSPYHHE